MNEREQFEAWAKKHGVQFVSRSSGEYTTGTVSLDALRELAALAASPVPAEAAALLREWQTCLGSSRESCDDQGRRVWDRIDAALAASPVPAGRVHWVVAEYKGNRVDIQASCGDLHDEGLTIHGNFSDYETKLARAREICAQLNAAPTTPTGLTEAETRETASVAGLSPAQPAEQSAADAVDVAALCDAVFKAAINCGHTISDKRITLSFNKSEPGHNALNQLRRRLDAAICAAIKEQRS